MDDRVRVWAIQALARYRTAKPLAIYPAFVALRDAVLPRVAEPLACMAPRRA